MISGVFFDAEFALAFGEAVVEVVNVDVDVHVIVVVFVLVRQIGVGVGIFWPAFRVKKLFFA